MPQGCNKMIILPWLSTNGRSIQSSSIFPKDEFEEEMDDVLTYTNDSENFKEEKIDAGQSVMDEKLAQYKRGRRKPDRSRV